MCSKHNGIANEIMYGATLIVAAMTPTCCFGLQIGDGSFVADEGSGCFSPMPEDAKLMGNLTTSLCDSDAIGSFRWFFREGCFDGIMLSSDGLINSFRCEEDFLSFGGRVLCAVADERTSHLSEHLRTRSHNGSRDDISIAAIIKEQENTRKD
ncbi:MAG: protein phosphatase 2C domain-containing protein [Oscillospiraceae bacterium]